MTRTPFTQRVTLTPCFRWRACSSLCRTDTIGQCGSPSRVRGFFMSALTNNEESPMDEGTPPFRYDARLANEIELRWQDRWEQDGTFHAPNRASTGPKFYLLDFFPYPSGIGLHVGHPLGYIGTDVFGRYLRMTGHQVLHPFGFDTFGLPAEQYAIDTGQHPAVTVRENAAVMRRQLRRLGLGHDPRREILTSDPSFYRWTQWIFLQIFNSWFDPRTGRARPVTELIAEFAAGQRPVPGPVSGGRPW